MSDKTQLVNIQKYLMGQPIDIINDDDGEYYLSTESALELAQQILDICQPHKKACERITVLALKHCPKSHHRDWEEVKALSYIFVPSTVPEDTA